ncbi:MULTISPECIES: hypothetical protein [unclassified Chamaesiphon]|uniref:hypothetical protein n=1 Tax=unclassified Chamaesiphon TaxID=2620921 RepID=UPI00286A9D9A|nr:MULTISPECIES: hypothetical protein [unclassified Chamaesiphon]
MNASCNLQSGAGRFLTIIIVGFGSYKLSRYRTRQSAEIWNCWQNDGDGEVAVG